MADETIDNAIGLALDLMNDGRVFIGVQIIKEVRESLEKANSVFVGMTNDEITASMARKFMANQSGGERPEEQEKGAN